MATLAERLSAFAGVVALDVKALFQRVTPAGGTAGQVLTKNSATNYDASWQTAGSIGGGASLTVVEVNVGATAKRSGNFVVVDAAILATDKVSVALAAAPYTNKGTRADEAELVGPITFTASPSDGSAVVYWSSRFVQRGNLKISYMRG